jgi:hypothetical protein
MPQFIALHPLLLLLDPKNPRLDAVEERQAEALHHLWAALGDKLLALAKDIVENGLDPSARLLAIPSSSLKDAYVVLEGNRRIAVLRALNEPELVRDQLSPIQRKNLATLSADYQTEPVEEVSCVVFEDRTEAEHWIELRHTGESQGAGVVPWGAAERARFKDRQGVPELAVQVVDLVREHGGLDEHERRQLRGRFVTTLRRFLNDPRAREALGITRDPEGRLRLLFPQDEALKALRRVVTDFARGEKDVKDVYYKEDRRTYIASLPPEDLPEPATKLAAPVAPGSAAAVYGTRTSITTLGVGAGPRVTGAPGPRKRLVPPGVRLKIPDRRMAAIFRELAQMRVDELPNAIAVLFRVFLELSADAYIKREGLLNHTEWEAAGLTHKMQVVLKHIGQNNLMTRQQLQPVRRAVQDNRHLLGGSLESLHAYVHNQHFAPKERGLLDAWDDLQPLFQTIWR